MQSPFDSATEHLLQEYILPMFPLPDGELTWRGGSELSTQSLVYYFSVDSNDYLLVREAYHGGDSKLQSSLIGNAVTSHEKIALVAPKEGVHTYARIEGNDIQSRPQLAGYFSVFHITS